MTSRTTTIGRPGRGSLPKQFAFAVGGLAFSAGLMNCSPTTPPPPPQEKICGESKQLEALGLTSDGSLVCFDGTSPADETLIGAITGLEGETLVGIDVRVPFTDAMGASNGVPAEGTLYGVGSNGGVYSIDTSTAEATKQTQLNVALEGTNFGVDFNPTVDRLRIVSDTGQNLRANVVTGETIVDGSLNTGGVPTSGIVAAAYTNNDTDPATGTTLYDIDASLDQVLLQSPPNAGGLATVGPLGVDTGTGAGFDLYSETREVSPGVVTTDDVAGWAVLSVGGQPGLYSITPFSGRAAPLGDFDADVVDLAFPLAQ